jgi:hypothetical protein
VADATKESNAMFAYTTALTGRRIADPNRHPLDTEESRIITVEDAQMVRAHEEEDRAFWGPNGKPHPALQSVEKKGRHKRN